MIFNDCRSLSGAYRLSLILVTVLLVTATGCMMSDHTGKKNPHSRWENYGGAADQSKYVDFKQLTKENVTQLQLAWHYPTSDNSQYLFSPIIVDTVMYVLAKNSSLVALHAVTGKEIWIHAGLDGIAWRGINYWESKDGKDKRILFTMRNTLQAIDAVTGKTIKSFGTNGYVSLREGLDRDPATVGRVQSNTPGAVYQDLLLLGSSPGENYFSAPGHLRAYHVVTGKLVWIFHTIPQPGEYGYETWPKDAYKYVGGANTWGEITVDEERGIAYFPVGSATYDYYGADREGTNLFSNCLLALDARTGKRLWHFQMTHHDLWDYDLTAAPQLVTVKQKGKTIAAVVQATKQGFLFAFDRVTGLPLWPIEERHVPESEMPGEKTWPTQPFPTVLPPFTRQVVKFEDINPYFTPEEKAIWKKRFDSARTGFYTPPSDQYETIIIPGAVGGANLGNTAANPAKGIVYVATQDYPSVFKLEKVEEKPIILNEADAKRVQSVYNQSCQSCHGAERQGAAGPALKALGERMNYDRFKQTIVSGRGPMPGFPHIDEKTMTAMFTWMGGNAANRQRPPGVNGPRGLPEGPVVDSGGAMLDSSFLQSRGRPMNGLRDYPSGLPVPTNRYTTDYGLQYSNLMSPVWSSIVAYDLNTGTVKWRKPIGQDVRVAKMGGKNTGIPIGTQRKGMIVTSSGLLFATSKGGLLYAFDADNGNVLWTTQLPRETQGLPAMYEIKGRQYIVVSATAPFTEESVDQSKLAGVLPAGYVVYALPLK
jgi:quinoprotein glucose dehydrogenase